MTTTTTTTTTTKPVTERALIQRLRRALAKEGERLIKNRAPWQLEPSNMGPYFLANDRNVIIDPWVNLEEVGRALGVLRSWERLVEDE